MAESPIPRISSSQPVWMQELQTQRRELRGMLLRQIEAKEDFQEWAEQGFNGVSTRTFRTLKEQEKHRYKVKEATQEEETENQEKIEHKGNVEDAASRFQERNPELQARTLKLLLSRLSFQDTAEMILAKVLEIYSDYSLADEALEFLIEVTGGSLKEKAIQAKEMLRANYEREILAGRNIASEAREFSEKGLGSPTALRDMYREITGTSREAYTLFEELFAKFPFPKMKTVIDFLLHSLGSDLKAKGPSISRIELTHLMEEIRIIQAILGVFLFFYSRMQLLTQQFEMYQIPMPPFIHFEALARSYLQLLQERYLSPERIYALGKKFNLGENALAQVILYTQFRDAVRQVAPRLYRSQKHKEDVLKALIEALEELEEEEEEEEET